MYDWIFSIVTCSLAFLWIKIEPQKRSDILMSHIVIALACVVLMFFVDRPFLLFKMLGAYDLVRIIFFIKAKDESNVPPTDSQDSQHE
jgi:hypothetical protein